MIVMMIWAGTMQIHILNTTDQKQGTGCLEYTGAGLTKVPVNFIKHFQIHIIRE